MEVSKAVWSEDGKHFYLTLRDKDDFLLLQVDGDVHHWEKKGNVLVIKTGFESRKLAE